MKSKVTYRIGTGEDTSIPNRATVTFQVDDSEIEVSLRYDEIRVRSTNRLVIQPTAANAVNLWVER